MEVSCLMLAAYAEMGQDGKLAMLSGDLDTILVPSTIKFPAASGTPLYLVGKVLFEPAECGRNYSSQIDFLAPDGTKLEGFDQPIILSQSTRPIKFGLLVAFAQLTIPAPGEYWIRLTIEGQEKKRIPLRVEHLPAAPAS